LITGGLTEGQTFILHPEEATNTLQFVYTYADYGFKAAVTYRLLLQKQSEIGFNGAVTLASAYRKDTLTITKDALNTALLSWQTDPINPLPIAVKLVIRATGINNPDTLYSTPVNVTIVPFGPPRLVLSLIPHQYILYSAVNDNYDGFVELTIGQWFTLSNPDNGKVYGTAGNAVIENGAAFVGGSTAGWSQLTVNTTALTYALIPYRIGAVGAFTGWGGQPDIAMDYDVIHGYWFATTELPAGPMKFRLNSDWGTNWGPGTDTDLPATGGTLSLPNSGGNIVITAAGNYTIKLVNATNNSTRSVTFIKN